MVTGRKPRRPPTHVARYGASFSLNLYVSPSLRRQLEEGTSKERKKAQDSICIKFQRAGSAKFGPQWSRRHPFIAWSNLQLAPLELSIASLPARPKQERQHGQAKQLVMHGECCDSDHCFVCSELNDHHRCTMGCTLRFEAA